VLDDREHQTQYTPVVAGNVSGKPLTQANAYWAAATVSPTCKWPIECFIDLGPVPARATSYGGQTHRETSRYIFSHN